MANLNFYYSAMNGAKLVPDSSCLQFEKEKKVLLIKPIDTKGDKNISRTGCRDRYTSCTQ